MKPIYCKIPIQMEVEKDDAIVIEDVLDNAILLDVRTANRDNGDIFCGIVYYPKTGNLMSLILDVIIIEEREIKLLIDREWSK